MKGSYERKLLIYSQCGQKPFPHFTGSLIGECDGQNAFRTSTPRDETSDAVGDDARLAGAGPGFEQEGGVEVAGDALADGLVGGRPVYAASQDFTVAGGAVGEATATVEIPVSGKLFHAAGANVTNDVFRMANLLQISSAMGRAMETMDRLREEYPPLPVPLTRVAEHIDHVVELVGIDHVGIGSGFDGSGDSMPDELKDVSGYPRLIEELQKRAYSVEDIEKRNLALTRSNLGLARARVDVGAAGRDEVLRWASQIAQDRRRVIEASAARVTMPELI